MPCRASQDGEVLVKSSEERNGKQLQYSSHKNSMNSVEKQKDMTPQDESPRSRCVLYATGEV